MTRGCHSKQIGQEIDNEKYLANSLVIDNGCNTEQRYSPNRQHNRLDYDW